MSDDLDIQDPAGIIAFWFSEPVKEKWFKPDNAFDAMLKERFGPLLDEAKSGALSAWAENPSGALALIILLDQIPRNICRGTPDAFAADGQALELAKQAVAKEFDMAVTSEERPFLYLPFMHSEQLQDQERGMELFAGLGLEEPLRFMQMHRDIIARFGRFPHRNEILGRPSTTEELAFLEQPGSRF